MLLMQILYYFSHIVDDATMTFSQKKFRCIYCPGYSFLYVGLMQAIAYSLLMDSVETVVVLVQGDHESWIIVPESTETDLLLGKNYAIDNAMINTFFHHELEVRYDDQAFDDLAMFWYHMPFIRITSAASKILPIIIPQKSQDLTAVLSRVLDDCPDAVLCFSWALSVGTSYDETKKQDDAILIGGISWSSVDGFADAPLFTVFCQLSQKQAKDVSFEYYENSYVASQNTDETKGYVVAGY